MYGNEIITENFSSSFSSDEDVPEEILNILCALTSDSLESDTSTEAPKPKRKLHRLKHFLETVEMYDEIEFKEHFRLKKATCNFLIERVKEDKVLPQHTHGRQKITPMKAVLMTIWYLSNQEGFRQISDRFNVTKSSAHRIVGKIIKYLVKNSNKFIKWPNELEKIAIREGFKNIQNIDGIVGAIDGCHILIKKPSEDAHVYCNRKSTYSILLQAVCDNKKRFLDVFCGETGSLHDARLLKKSSLYEKGVNGLLGVDFLIGDSAYPCLQWLILPFKDNGHLSQQQRIFNYRHSASRIVIEHAFGLLKVAATVLHNICLDFDDEVEYQLEDAYEDSDERYNNNPNDISITARRDMIMTQMFNT